jgi:iron complex outermembrane receptor protein
MASAGLALPLFLSAALSPAMAQAVEASPTADADPGSILVTARLRQEDVQRVPVPISVASGATLDLQRIQSPRQIDAIAANLNITQANPRQTIFGIRGIGGTTQVSDGLDSSVGVYEDGVYLGRPGELAYDFLDLDQISVLRGPQGTLYGRNSIAGAINIQSAAPSFQPGAFVQSDLGNYAYRRFAGSVTGPLIDDTLAFRLTGYDVHRGGFDENRQLGTDENGRRGYGVRGQLLFTPASNFSYRLTASYNREYGRQGEFQFLGNQPTAANGWSFARSAALVAPGYAPPADPFRRIVDNDADESSNTHQLLISGQGDWTIGGGYKLTSITAYQSWAFNPSNDADFTALPVATNTNFVNHAKQFSQELRLSSPKSDRFEWVLGAYYFRQTVRGLSDTTYDSDGWAFNTTLAGLANGTAARAASLSSMLDGLSYVTHENPDSRSYAGYGQFTYHLTPTLSLTGGFRDTWERKNQDIASFGSGNVQLLQCATLGTGCGFGGYTITQANAQKATKGFPVGTAEFGRGNNLLSGLATLAWQVRPDTMLYATYSHSEESAGVNVGLLSSQLLANGITEVVSPERANNYEVGFKTALFDRRLTLNIDGFWETVADYQTNAVFLINGSATQALANAGGIRSRGVEADAAFSVTPELHLRASGSFTDARYTDYPNAPCPPEATASGRTVCSLTGRRVANAPRGIVNLAGDYQHRFVSGIVGYAEADWSYRSSQNLLTDDSSHGRIGGYGIVDMRVGVKLGQGRYDVSMWVQNLTGRNYLTNIQENNGAFLGYLGDPRTFGASFRVTI